MINFLKNIEIMIDWINLGSHAIWIIDFIGFNNLFCKKKINYIIKIDARKIKHQP